MASDGRQITKKIRTLEGTKYEEVEEWESTEIDGKKTEKHSKRSTPSKPIASNPDKKQSAAAEAALKDLVSQEIVIVPGHTKVEFDEKTNTKTITEKTTTGHQVTTLTTFPDGRTKTQTRTFYDPISVPVGEDEYEEEEEEEEIIEESYVPSSTTTQTTSNTNKNQQLQNIDHKQVSKNTSNVSTVGEQTKTSTQSKQVTQQQSTVTQQQSTKTTSQTQVQSQSTKSQTEQQSIKNTQNTQNTKNTQIVKKDDNTNKQVAIPNQPRTTIVKKKLDTGEEIEIHTTISEDGLSKSCRRIVTKPAEELEVTEYEETHTYEPGEVKIRTTTKTVPSGTQTETTTTSQQTSTKKVTESTQSVQKQQQTQQQEHTQHQQITSNQQQQITSKQQQQHQQQTTKDQTNVTDRQLMNIDTQNQNIVSQLGQNVHEDFVAAQHSTKRTKVTESVTMIVQDEHGTSGFTKTKQQVNKQQNVSASQTGKEDLNTSRNQTTFTEEEHVLTQEEIEQMLKHQKNTDTKQITQEISSLSKEQIDQLLQQHYNNTKNTKQTTQQTSILSQEQVEELKRLQQIKSTQQTTQQTTQKTTQQQKTQQTTQQQQQQQQTTQQQKTTQQTTQQTSKLTKDQMDKQETEMRKQMQQQQKQSNVDEKFTKNQNQTIRMETHTITSTSEKTFTTNAGHVVTRPETLPGEKTTEEVRYFPGGVEYIWRTVRGDGSSKMSMRTFYDPVPVEEEEVYDETTTIEGPVVAGKKKLPAAHAFNVDAQSGMRK